MIYRIFFMYYVDGKNLSMICLDYVFLKFFVIHCTNIPVNLCHQSAPVPTLVVYWIDI